jgi:hypothetical protein
MSIWFLTLFTELEFRGISTSVVNHTTPPPPHHTPPHTINLSTGRECEIQTGVPFSLPNLTYNRPFLLGTLFVFIKGTIGWDAMVFHLGRKKSGYLDFSYFFDHK